MYETCARSVMTCETIKTINTSTRNNGNEELEVRITGDTLRNGICNICEIQDVTRWARIRRREAMQTGWTMTGLQKSQKMKNQTLPATWTAFKNVAAKVEHQHRGTTGRCIG